MDDGLTQPLEEALDGVWEKLGELEDEVARNKLTVRIEFVYEVMADVAGEIRAELADREED